MKRRAKVAVTLCLAAGLAAGLVSGLFWAGRYVYIQSAYSEPFTVASEVVEDAVRDLGGSAHLASGDEWAAVSETSSFRNIREPLDWAAFKAFVRGCGAPNTALSVDSGKTAYRVMRQTYQDNHRIVGVACFEYDPDSGRLIGMKDVNLLLEKIEDVWKVVGITRE